MKDRIDVIIPTYKPDQTFEKLIMRLQNQTLRPSRILVVNTEEKLWEEASVDKTPFIFGTLADIRLDLIHVKASEFDHGGTRKMAVETSDADFVLLMTQDALPKDRYLIENLRAEFDRDPAIGAAYARQLAADDCGYLERYTRSFNYPDKSCIKSREDLDRMGIKTFFCSDVCAMYRREIYEKEGGFVSRTIFNEDMILAGHMIFDGYKVAYVSEAKVIHSHNYSFWQQFQRNFDLAVSQSDYPEIFSAVKSESEGIALVKKTASYLMREGKPHLIVKLIWQSGWKYLGYKLGLNYQKLPIRVILKCTSNQNFWKYKN